MTETQTQILVALNRPDAFLAIDKDRAHIFFNHKKENAVGGPFRPKEYRPLIAAGCIIPALSLGCKSNENVYRLWDIETAARAQGTQA